MKSAQNTFPKIGKKTPRKMHYKILAKALSIALLGMSLLISFNSIADVIVEENFDSGTGIFTGEGRVYPSTNSVRLRGGVSFSAITSSSINTTGFSDLSLSFTRITSGLDSGEVATAWVAINGSPFTPIEAVQNVNGRATFPISGTNVNSLELRFSLTASSYFETLQISQIVLEGVQQCEGSACCNDECCEDDCGNHDDHTTIIPDSSWTCQMPSGIPDPTTGTLLFTANLSANSPLNIGQTPYGQRQVTPVNGGNIQNAAQNLNGQILDGALDFDLFLPSGALEHESRYTLRTNDRTLIYMRNCGIADGDNTRFVADFEAPNNSNYAWLNSGRYVGIRRVTATGITLEVYSNPTAQQNHAVVYTPADNQLPQQSWQCPTLESNADSGREILRARVGIGSFQTIGASKYGERRIIPITGGSFSGSAASGSVNPGGADFQLTVNDDLSLEARYTLRTNSGELIAVRNCGDYANGSLTLPLFETRINGPYSYLNENQFVGTITPGFSRVTITIFEKE